MNSEKAQSSKRQESIRLRKARAKMYKKLYSRVNPNNAATANQYEYASVKNPRDFRTSIPNGSVEFGRTFDIKVFLS